MMFIKWALFVLLGFSITELNAQSCFSPKLAKFLVEHPAASVVFSNAMSQASSNRIIQIFYYYTADKRDPGSCHRYVDNLSVVGIYVRENQPVIDECISILFEAVNSKGEQRFRELYESAKTGSISKNDYVREILRVEFQAVKATKGFLRALNLTSEEISQSEIYNHFVNSPTNFDVFLIIVRKFHEIGLKKRTNLFTTICTKPLFARRIKLSKCQF